MFKWIIFAVLAFGIAVAGSIFFRAGLTEVRPNEIAFITQNGKIVGELKPGLRWKVPILYSVAYIAPYSTRKQTFEMSGILSDGSKCPLKLNIHYYIANPRLAYKWRHTNGLDSSKQSLGSGRIDYEGPKQVVKRLLMSVMKDITPQEAAIGDVERWLYKNRVKKIRSITADDGTRIRGLEGIDVSCSQRQALGERHRRKPRKSGKPQRFTKNQRKETPTGQVYMGKKFSIEAIYFIKKIRKRKKYFRHEKYASATFK